jgi:hypothetical protein
VGWFSGATTDENLFRRSVSGERIYAPIGDRGPLFVVSGASADRIRRDVNAYLQLLLAFIFVATLLRLAFAILVTGSAVTAVGWRGWLARGLPLTSISRTDLRPVDRKARYLANARATGRKVLRLMLVLSIAMGFIGLASVHLGEGIGWLLAAMMFSCAVFFVWQINLLNKDKGSH